MNFPAKNGFTTKLAAVLCCIVAVTLQVQVTLFASDTYLGLRVNLTDLILPFAGAGIVFTLWKKTSVWPQWTFPALVKWLCIITALLSFAFINGTLSFDEISRWALINKLIGWFVLVTILGMGGWIGSNATQKSLEVFVKIFTIAILAIMTYELGIIVLQSYPAMREWVGYNKYSYYPITGMMANRNAYGLLFLATAALLTCFHFAKPDTRFFKNAALYLYFMSPIFLLFNGSRATFIAYCVLTPLILLTHKSKPRKCLTLILAFVLGAGATYAIFHDKQEELTTFQAKHYEVLEDAKGAHSLDEIGEKVTYPGDSMRLTILQDAIEMVQMRPLIGSGLGGMMAYQKQKHGHVINIIDCTPLWILVEMGVIGLLLFAAFYIKIAVSIFQSWRTSEDFSKTFRLSLLFILLAFTIMSLFHEIMYTRFIWFFLGLGLALPLKMHLPAQSV